MERPLSSGKRLPAVPETGTGYGTPGPDPGNSGLFYLGEMKYLFVFFNLSTLSSRDSLEFTDVNSVLKKSKKEGTSEEEATDPAENVKSKRHRKAANEEEFQNCNELASDATHELGSEFDCSASRIFSRSEPNLLLETEQASKLTSFEARENQGGKISNSGESDITEPLAAKPVMFSLVKLARNGLLFFSLPVNHFSNIVAVLTNIFQSMDSGEIKPPL
eukprot:Gb_38142 [translate_table: standard]